MDRLEKDIKKRFEGFEAEPPVEVWSSIENRLDAKDAAQAGYKRRKIAAIAAAVLLFLVSASGLIINQFQIRTNAVNQQITSSSSSTTQNNQENSLTDERSREFSNPLPVETDDKQNPDNLPTEHALQSKTQLALTENINKNEDPVVPSRNIFFSDVALSSKMPSLFAETISLQPLKPGLAKANMVFPATSQMREGTSKHTDVNLSASLHDTPSSFSLTSYFAPQHSYRYQSGNTSHPMQALESEIMTFAAGLQINYRINNRWEVQSGLGFNRIGQRIKDIATFSHPSKMALYSGDGANIGKHPQSMNTSMGGVEFTDQSLYFADISSSRIITLKGSYDESIVNLLNKTGTGLIQHFEYLEMPVNVRYKLWQKGLEISAKAGLSAHYLLSGKVFLPEQTQNTPIGKVVGINTLNFSGMAGMAFNYPVSGKVSLSLEPTASMFLTPMGNVRNLTRETHPYSWSLMMGLSYRL